MLTLPSTPELESRLEEEAAKRGMPAAEYALRLLEALMKSDNAGNAADKARLSAIDELMGAAADSTFSSASLRAERNREREMEEERHLRRFGRERAA